VADSTPELMLAIVAKLKADAGVGAIAGDRIYDRVPESVTYPFVGFGFRSGEPWEAQLVNGWNALMTINIWSRNYGSVEAENLSKAVYEALHDVALSLSTQTFGFGKLVTQDTQPQGDGITTLIRQRWEFITTD